MENPSTPQPNDSWQPLTIPDLKPKGSAQSLTPILTARITELAAERAKLLFGCFRTGQAENPDVYVGAVAATLARYPESVIIDATDPTNGLAGRYRFLPTISEVKDFCEFAVESIRKRNEIEERRRAQLEERQRIDAEQQAIKAMNVERINGLAKRFREGVPPDPWLAQRPTPPGEWTPQEAEARLAKVQPIGAEHAEDVRRLMGRPPEYPAEF